MHPQVAADGHGRLVLLAHSECKSLASHGVLHVSKLVCRLSTVCRLVCWVCWQMLNFRFVAFPNRAAVGSLAGVVWNVYLSSQVNGTKAGDE